MTARTLSARRREALRLDLEDLQRSLIDDIWHLSRSLFGDAAGAASVVACELIDLQGQRAALATDPGDQLLWEVDRLRQVTVALKRLPRAEYGFCSVCGEPIAFEVLASDPARERCDGCSD